MERVGHRGRRAPWLVALAMLVAAAAADAQTRFSYSSGQTLEPAYEGWWKNPDGSYTLIFGYMNTNWQQEFDITFRSMYEHNLFPEAIRGKTQKVHGSTQAGMPQGMGQAHTGTTAWREAKPSFDAGAWEYVVSWTLD